MARLARVVVPGHPHHVTQRGNRRQQTFFSDTDYQLYKGLLASWCAREGVEIWAYCLMPNHLHLVATPHRAQALAAAIGEAHRRYTRAINFGHGWRGYLLVQEPFLRSISHGDHAHAAVHRFDQLGHRCQHQLADHTGHGSSRSATPLPRTLTGVPMHNPLNSKRSTSANGNLCPRLKPWQTGLPCWFRRASRPPKPARCRRA